MGELLKGKVLFPGTDCILPQAPTPARSGHVVFELLGFRRRLGGSVPLVHCCRL